jgi:hypothetical protein
MVNFRGTAEAGELVDVLIDSATSMTLRGAQTVPSQTLVRMSA